MCGEECGAELLRSLSITRGRERLDPERGRFGPDLAAWEALVVDGGQLEHHVVGEPVAVRVHHRDGVADVSVRYEARDAPLSAMTSSPCRLRAERLRGELFPRRTK